LIDSLHRIGIRSDSVREFVAQIRQRSDGGYCASFPDLPTVRVDGETLEHVRARAEVALLIHLRRMVLKGASIPEPLSLKAFEADPRHQGALKTMIVALIEINLEDDADGGADAALWICSRHPKDIARQHALCSPSSNPPPHGMVALPDGRRSLRRSTRSSSQHGEPLFPETGWMRSSRRNGDLSEMSLKDNYLAVTLSRRHVTTSFDLSVDCRFWAL
jgi:predicted RNase H-like HicB family nuclease